LIRTWTFTDSGGNTSSVSQTIIVEDNEPPVIHGPLPEDLILECASEIPAAAELTATDNCGQSWTKKPVVQYIPEGCPNQFTLVRTWTFKDTCNNISSHTQTITVEDNEPPVIQGPLPEDLILECATEIPAAVELTAIDNCGQSWTRKPVVQYIPEGCPNRFTLVRIWTFKDTCNNISSHTQTITVEDNEPPVIQGPLPQDLTLECATEIPAAAELTAIDNCGEMWTKLPVTEVTPGDCPNSFTLVRTWTFVDTCGNASSVTQTINVNMDFTMPPDGSGIIACPTDLYTPVPPDVYDYCGNQIIPTGPEIEGAIPDCEGDVTYVWTYKDCSGKWVHDWKYTFAISAPVWSVPADESKTVSCSGDAVEPVPPIVTDNCGRDVPAELVDDDVKLKWAIICEREVIYTFRYKACDGSTDDWTFTYNVEYEDVVMPPDGHQTISSANELYTPTPPPIYDNCGHLLKTEGPTNSPIPEGEGAVTYTWAYLDCNNKEVYWRYTFIIESTSGANTTILGNTEVYGGTTTAANRRALPVTFDETGEIQSISVYHNGGTGNVLLGVYSDGSGSPASLLGVTSPTLINGTEGWQTVSLISSVPVTSGQTVWLAWVFQNNPGIRYTTGTPARAQSYENWSGGIPAIFGSSSFANYRYSTYCTYIPGSSEESKSAEILVPKVVFSDFKVYPNPFSDRVRFEFTSPVATQAQIDVYDMLGRKVQTVFEGPAEGGVTYNVYFKPETVISGMYIYRMTLGQAVYNGKLVYKTNK
jgi:hypothetical protein